GFLTSVMTGTAYETSAEMASRLGAFAGYKLNQKSMLKVMKKHQSSVAKIQWSLLPPEFKKISTDIWKQVLFQGTKHGYRNSQATVIAPTGTIGLVMDCDTTGIEPDFSLIKNKKLSGGGYLKIVNQSVPSALKKLSYSEEQIGLIVKQIAENSSMLNSGIHPEHYAVFSCATGDMALSPEAHLKMMAAVQPFISGAISKTVNLPESATLEDISNTYKRAWQLGLKSVAVYRDNSKFTQPLTQAKPVVKASVFPRCTECGYETILESGCYRCVNCGTTTACSS
ncbi:MAG: vitamin B12-dependent ribonucleotide reductase, partial [Pseudobdellovibrio sp.]